MEKAYDPKALIEKLKAKGIDAADHLAKDIIECVFEFGEESIKMSDNKFDDLLLQFMPAAKDHLLAKIDEVIKPSA